MTPADVEAARQRGCDLADLRLFWGDWYVIDWDTVFTATRIGEPETVLRHSAKLGLHHAMLGDHTKRPLRPVADYG